MISAKIQQYEFNFLDSIINIPLEDPKLEKSQNFS